MSTEGSKEHLCQVMGKKSFTPVEVLAMKPVDAHDSKEDVGVSSQPLREAAQASMDERSPDKSLPLLEPTRALPGESPMDISSKGAPEDTDTPSRMTDVTTSRPSFSSQSETTSPKTLEPPTMFRHPSRHTTQSATSSSSGQHLLQVPKSGTRSDVTRSMMSNSRTGGVQIREEGSGSSSQGLASMGREKLGRVTLAVHGWLENALIEQDASLRRPPALAVLHNTPSPQPTAEINDGSSVTPSESGYGSSGSEDPNELPPEVHVCAQASVTFYGAPRQLIILRMGTNAVDDKSGAGMTDAADVNAVLGMTPALQLWHLKQVAERSLGMLKPDDGPWMWPLYETKVCEAVLLLEQEMTLGLVQTMKRMPRWQRLLYELRIYTPEHGGPFIDILQDQFGPGAAFCFAWGHFYTQQLWILAALVAVWLVWCVIFSKSAEEAGMESRDGGWWELVAHPQRRARAAWEIGKLAVIIWGVVVVCPWRKLYIVVRQPKKKKTRRLRTQRTLNPNFNEEVRSWKWRACLFLFAVVPLMGGFVLMVNLALLGITMLLINLTYEWGDCLNLGCKDPQEKHGFWGWLAEVGVDVLLAILFELFFAIAKGIAECVATLRNYRYRQDYLFTKDVLTVFLAAIERIGTFGMLAMFFVPQWTKEPDSKQNVPRGKLDKLDCSNLLFGTMDIHCFARYLSVEQRRNVFEQSMKGPFVVAPLVGIIVKVLVPLLAERLDRLSRSCARGAQSFWDADRLSHELSIMLSPSRRDIDNVQMKRMRCVLWFFIQPMILTMSLLTRITALIFVYECEAVGCLRLVFFGWPFTDYSVVESPASAQECDSSAGLCPLTDLEGPGIHDHGEDEEPFEIPSCSLESLLLSHPGGATLPSNDVTDAWKDFGATLRLSIRDRMLRGALLQGVRKPFEPLDELIEMKMNFIWIMFFVPVFPIGIFPMLLCRLLETKTDLTKMLFIRRRIFPEEDRLQRMTQTAFIRAALVASIGWHVGLSLITYNDDLWKSEFGKRLISGGVGAWLLLSVFVALSYNSHAISRGSILLLLVILCASMFVGKLFYIKKW